MVLSRIPEERITGRHRAVRNSAKTRAKHQSASNISTRSASQTTAIANETFSSTTSSTDDTLSMISTPWSTESWRSYTRASTLTSNSRLTWTNSEIDSSTTHGPVTTTTYGVPSPDVKTGSNNTVMVLGEVTSPSARRHLQPLNRQNSGSSPTYDSWTLETYTSTGLVSSLGNDVRVNYPWSPNTFMSGSDFTDYPSSFTLISRKGSRAGFDKLEARNQWTPMNYVVLTKDDHPMLDWVSVKQNGIPIRKE